MESASSPVRGAWQNSCNKWPCQMEKAILGSESGDHRRDLNSAMRQQLILGPQGAFRPLCGPVYARGAKPRCWVPSVPCGRGRPRPARDLQDRLFSPKFEPEAPLFFRLRAPSARGRERSRSARSCVTTPPKRSRATPGRHEFSTYSALLRR